MFKLIIIILIVLLGFLAFHVTKEFVENKENKENSSMVNLIEKFKASVLDKSREQGRDEYIIDHETPDRFEGSNINIGGNHEHLEMAYSLCQSNPDSRCRKYVHHYEGLRKTFHKLKDNYCQNNPSHCMEIGL